MKTRIQTRTYQSGWVDCEHDSWRELKEDGWVFEYATPEGWIVMTRKGYIINVFRTNPKSEVSPK